jgi:hypothetical protein
MIPRDSPCRNDSATRNLGVLFIHYIATLARLLGPGGVRSLVAETLLSSSTNSGACVIERMITQDKNLSIVYGLGFELAFERAVVGPKIENAVALEMAATP